MSFSQCLLIMMGCLGYLIGDLNGLALGLMVGSGVIISFRIVELQNG